MQWFVKLPAKFRRPGLKYAVISEPGSRGCFLEFLADLEPCHGGNYYRSVSAAKKAAAESGINENDWQIL